MNDMIYYSFFLWCDCEGRPRSRRTFSTCSRSRSPRPRPPSCSTTTMTTTAILLPRLPRPPLPPRPRALATLPSLPPTACPRSSPFCKPSGRMLMRTKRRSSKTLLIVLMAVRTCKLLKPCLIVSFSLPLYFTTSSVDDMQQTPNLLFPSFRLLFPLLSSLSLFFLSYRR